MIVMTMKNFWMTMFSLAALCSAAGCASGYRLGPGAELGDFEVCAVPGELRLAGKRGCLAFKPNSDRARIDGAVDLVLPSPMRYEDGKFVLEKPVIDRVISPLLFRRPLRAGTIMLDPGHGGADAGTPGTLVPEKTLNLAVALKLRSELEKRGFKVLMTRDRDVAVPLDERVRLAGLAGAGLFISIHHDAAENRKARGYSVYALRDDSKYSGDSVVLAAALQREIVKLPEVVDRGVRFANFRVLRSPMPAVLVELGFVSNPEEEKLMNDPRRQAAEAAAIADGIANSCAGTGEKRP